MRFLEVYISVWAMTRDRKTKVPTRDLVRDVSVGPLGSSRHLSTLVDSVLVSVYVRPFV